MEQHERPLHLQGPFHFLLPELGDVERLFAKSERVLPEPQAIFLEREEATPLTGFPILMNDRLGELREAFDGYIDHEERAQVAIANRVAYSRKAYDAAWNRYKLVLEQITENVIASSYGRRLPSVFWLYHSTAVCRRLKESPKRILRLDLDLAKLHGDAIKYEVYRRWVDRVTRLTQEISGNIANEFGEHEHEIFPSSLGRMKDNILVLTEDFISPSLSELGSFFQGYLNIDLRSFVERLARVRRWHLDQIKQQRDLREVVRHLMRLDLREWAPRLLSVSGYLTYLSRRPNWDPQTLLSNEQVVLYEKLLLRLKEYELLVAHRKMLVPVRERAGRLLCRDPLMRTTGTARGEVALSSSTRPLDFQTPWVIDPKVERFALIYDITDFSAVLSLLRRGSTEKQYESFRNVFRFQVGVNQVAQRHRLKLEKYLGDGAFYSCREPQRALTVSILLQRLYTEAVGQGFSFDRGIRMALNFGEYRLLPLREHSGPSGLRYEFFGHGVVELSRLSTGKATEEIQEIRTLLVGLGYPPQEVDDFFRPLQKSDADIVDRDQQKRTYYAYINRNGSLVNEGIVATESFLRHLETRRGFSRLGEITEGRMRFVVVDIADEGEKLRIGIRSLGRASLKGLGKIPIYEVVDGEHWASADVRPVPGFKLMRALSQSTLSASTPFV